MDRSIAIVGANGRLGQAAARAFREAGWRVGAVTRRGDSAITGTSALCADATNGVAVASATRGHGFLLHAINPPYTAWEASVLPMLANSIEAARRNGPPLLFPGNVYNFGSSIPAEPDEDTAPSPDHRKAAIRVKAEAMLREASARDGVRSTILRAGDFFGGPVRGGWFDLALASAIDRGRFIYPGPPDLVHAWAYLPDFARAFVAAAEAMPRLPEFACLHFGGHNVTLEQMHRATEVALGRPLAKKNFPWPLFRMGAIFVPMWREIVEMRYLWDRPHCLSGARFDAATGGVTPTALDEAVRRALVDLGIVAPDRSPPRDLRIVAAASSPGRQPGRGRHAGGFRGPSSGSPVRRHHRADRCRPGTGRCPTPPTTP